MSEPKLISPLLDRFYMGDPISEHHGVRCCPAMEKLTEDKYIVKIISLPATQVQMDALLLSGAYADRADALAYFNSVAQGIADEVKVLEKLSQLEGFIAFDGYQIVPMDDDGGYDVYLLSSYYRTLDRYMHKQPVTQLDALNLGLDLCAALAICRRSGYLYVNLKPENIAMRQDKEFRIADLGFVPLNSLKYASLPDRYRSKYTAPEITDAFSSLNTTLDIYAAGMILYQIFNGGQLPTLEENEELPPPAYADYEMSEIILKACCIDPEARWQDPVEMGQALVSYMQRNGAHDIPIVAPVIPSDTAMNEAGDDNAEIPDVDDEETTGLYEDTGDASSDESAEVETEATSDDVSESAAQDTESEPTDDAENAITYAEDEQGVLSFILPDSEDETAPENADDHVEYDEVTPEVTDMLNQADDLIAHKLPDPVVAPDPIEISIPSQEDQNVTSQVEEVTDTLPQASEATDTDNDDNRQQASDQPDNEDPEMQAEEEAAEASEESEASEEQPSVSTDDPAAEEITEEVREDNAPDDEKPAKKPWRIVRYILLAVLILLLLAGGFFFYKNYYLQTVDGISVDDTTTGIITINVQTQIPEEQLTVLCIDTYGNQLSSSVLNGKARFSGLAPKTVYTFKVDISGFHDLVGETEISFTTPDVTKIVQFQALTGNEDGSVILNFTPNGTEPEQWLIRYQNDNGETVENIFSGHMQTITGLTIGKEYTFKLEAASDLRISGEVETKHTASKIIKANNVTITGCYMNKLGITWEVPEGSTVSEWIVRCHNESGYDETITTGTTEAAFDINDDHAAYTVEVTASGMSVGERADISENSVTIGVFNADTSDPSKMVLSWKSSRELPEDGWIVTCTLNGQATQEFKAGADNTVTISPLVPGCQYVVTLAAADGSDILGTSYQFETAAANDFTGYGVDADDMVFMMCNRPSYSGWDHYDVPDSSFRTTFADDEDASYVIRLRTTYNTSSDDIVALFVIRDKDGKIISTTTSTETWEDMWHRGYCELDVPSLPTTPGQYNIRIYFNNQWVNTNNFSITD